MSDTVIEPAAEAPAGTQTATPETAPSGTPTQTNEAPASEAPKDAGSVLSGEPDDKPVAAPADWPADWREKLAGDDKAFLNVLKRYTSPMTYAKAGFEAQQKIRSGEVKKPLGADASPEEIAAFRKENGIPETPDAYAIQLPDGMVPGEIDKPILDAFKGFAHNKNWTPGQLNEVVGWYYQQQDQIAAQQYVADKTLRMQSEEALRAEWGPEYRSNVNAIQNFLAGAPEGVSEAIINARGPDGAVLGNNPMVLRWLADLAREAMPGAGLVPAGTSNPSAAIETEIENINRLMQTEPQKYWSDEKMQSRYRDLLGAQERAKGR
jgi:hypothetical protein